MAAIAAPDVQPTARARKFARSLAFVAALVAVGLAGPGHADMIPLQVTWSQPIVDLTGPRGEPDEVAGTEYFIAINAISHVDGAWGWHETVGTLDYAAIGGGFFGTWATAIPETNLAFELMTVPEARPGPARDDGRAGPRCGPETPRELEQPRNHVIREGVGPARVDADHRVRAVAGATRPVSPI